MLYGILGAVALVVIGFLVIVAMRPSEFRITRSGEFSVPASAIFPHVNDFHRWQAWSPWAEMDPNAKNMFEGPSAGTGSKFAWAGNKEVGEGRMTIIESHPDELVRIKLDFVKPFPSTSTAEFTFKPEGNGARVTWSMFGRQAFIPKAVCMFMNMDKMVGGQFEKGLAKLRAVVEPG